MDRVDKARGRADLDECELANEFRPALEEAFEGGESFHEALGVVHSIDADAEVLDVLAPDVTTICTVRGAGYVFGEDD